MLKYPFFECLHGENISFVFIIIAPLVKDGRKQIMAVFEVNE